MSHFPVLKLGKSTTCRIVWNSTAASDGLVLNSSFHKSPDLLNNLFSILLSWRKSEIAIVGDIKKTIYQIQLKPIDRIYDRILWKDNDITSLLKINYQWKQLPFGDKPAPDLSIDLLHFLSDRCCQTHSIGTFVMKYHSHIRDFATSFSNDAKAMTTKLQIDEILSKGKFAVKGWHFNSSTFDKFPGTFCTDALGLSWNKSFD